jgi:CheY-like chemotaxis protein
MRHCGSSATHWEKLIIVLVVYQSDVAELPIDNSSTYLIVSKITEGSNMGNEMILVAEDDPASRLVLVHALEVAGFRVAAAQDGREALHLLNEHSGEVDAIVTDCFMPEIDGLKLAKLVRERFPKKMPIIMVTSLEYSLAPELLCENGIDYVVGKPFSPKAICKLVRDIVDDRSAQQTTR